MVDDALDIDPVQNNLWIAQGMEAKRYEYDIQPDELILDLGAYQGEWTRKMHDKYGCNAIMFEPVDILGEFKDKDWCRVITAAAWVYDGVLSFGGNGYWTSHYIYGNQEYPCVDILKYLNQDIAVCKINIEGGEYDLLRHILNSGMQKNIKNFQIQFHNWNEECPAQRAKIREMISLTHKQTWCVDWVWENWERC